MLSAIFTYIGQVITAFLGVLGSAFSEMQDLFFVSTEGNISGLTFLGSLTLIAVGVGLVYFCWRVVASLIRQRKA